MPTDDTTIRRYNELKTRQMAIKKVGEKDKQKRKQTQSDKKR
jgi:hypothetical protein